MCLGSHKAMVPCYLKSLWDLVGGDNEGSSALLLAAGGALHRADVPGKALSCRCCLSPFPTPAKAEGRLPHVVTLLESRLIALLVASKN